MTNPTPPDYQHFSCWQADGSPRAADNRFEASEKLFRGFTSFDLEEKGGAMPGICFSFNPCCSVNRDKFCDWESVGNGRPHMGVLEVTVETVSISSKNEGNFYQTNLLHTPNHDQNNYAHTDIEVPARPHEFSKNACRRIVKHWRTKLDERLNDGNSEQWTTHRLRDARPKDSGT